MTIELLFDEEREMSNFNSEDKNALEKLEVELQYLTQTRMGRRAFMSALPILMASCSTVDQTRFREGNNDGQKTSLSVSDEQKMAQDYLPKMKKDYPALRNDEAQRYISNLGQKIVKANGLAGKPYHYRFTLVDAKNVNAFALPAGEVMVTAPLLAMAESEAELAGVVGHEVGHVVARHTAERIDQAQKTQKKSMWYTLGGGLLGGAAGIALGRMLCKKSSPTYRECLKRATKYGGMAGAGAGLLITKYAFMANSREDEMEADRVGFKTSVAAGYHKDHVGNFYNKLLQMEQQRKSTANAGFMARVSDAMSTHPPSRERVSQMSQMASQTGSHGNGVISTKQFERIKSMVKKA